MVAFVERSPQKLQGMNFGMPLEDYDIVFVIITNSLS